MLVEKNMTKAHKKRKKQYEEELHTFENMSVSDSDEESINVGSNEKGKIRKEGSDANLNLNLIHSSNQ